MLIGEHRIPQISVGVHMEKRGKLRHTITTVAIDTPCSIEVQFYHIWLWPLCQFKTDIFQIFSHCVLFKGALLRKIDS